MDTGTNAKGSFKTTSTDDAKSKKATVTTVKTMDQPSVEMLKAAIKFLSMQVSSAAQHEAFKTAFPELFK